MDWRAASRRTCEQAGTIQNAASVLLVGADRDSPEEGFRQVLPIDKAMHPDTLLAYAMNGEPLPKDHGFPLRALVPGWVGSYSIKWLNRIEVSSRQLWTRNNTSSYVLIGDSYPPEGEALGQVAREQVVKSALALPWPASLAFGPQLISGYAHSPSVPSPKSSGASTPASLGTMPPSCHPKSNTPGPASSSNGPLPLANTR